ncbi:MAG: FAD-dependent oxidoreductase [Myxococcota bacterium]
MRPGIVPPALLAPLPSPLVERTRIAEPRTSWGPGTFVLYWMHSAARGHENPALDVALGLARESRSGLLVYHGLSERYPFASLRLHAFALEGAADVAEELAARKIPYAFHLERKGHREKVLAGLAAQARVVVTEDVPVPFLRRWTRKLAATTRAPVLLVDTACTVPMAFVSRQPQRAYAYREATASLRTDRIRTPYVEQPVPEGLAHPELPFTPFDVRGSTAMEAIATCDIDQGLPPVGDTRGGSQAGYDRWRVFFDNHLDSYDRRRNDPLDAQGVSRMSAYLHFGHVSPFRLAREAAARGGTGAAKFLDELCVWRELAWSFCDHITEEDTSPLALLPRWAAETLERHAGDRREQLLSWERLARATSDDKLWDAAQRSLLRHGELHNNVRMTWAKALPLWTKSPGDAAAMLFDLNDRFALDGRDPSSVGGLLWALGLFDRPFPEERPVLGSVRERPLHEHAARLDVARYATRTARGTSCPWRVAVVGAGLSGLSCARALQDQGVCVKVFDKGRRLGGRLATRLLRDDEVSFDLGAQYFTARHPVFLPFVQSWLDDGLIAPWPGPIGAVRPDGGLEEKHGTVRYVAQPGMRSLAERLAEGIDILEGVRVLRLERRAAGWFLGCENDFEGPYDCVLLTIPPEQAADLLEPMAPDFWGTLSEVRSEPVHAVGFAFHERLPIRFDGLFVNGTRLAFAARDSSKPGRTKNTKHPERWVLHATEEFTRAHLDDSGEEVAAALLDELFERTGVEPAQRMTPSLLTHQRWLLARAGNPLNEGSLYDGTLCLGVGGDWCHGTKVEGAFLSGRSLAGCVFRHLHALCAP